MPNEIESDIILFYKGHKDVGPYKAMKPCVNTGCYTIFEVWDFSDEELEKIHNYIQWLFPTCDPRNKDNGKPFLTDEDILCFTTTKDLQDNMLRSYNKMLKFYGFVYSDNGKLTTCRNFKEKSKKWINKGNHNYLRLTRMISCLKSVHMDKEAKELYFILRKLYEKNKAKISETTMEFWTKAFHEILYDGYTKPSEVFIGELKDKLKSITWSLE